MPRALYALLCSLAASIAIITLWGCDKSANVNNALAVKRYVSSQIKSDTATYLRDIHRKMDSLPLHTEEDCRELYRYVNTVTSGIYQEGDNARAMRMLREVFNILRSSDDRTHTDTRQLINMYVNLGTAFMDQGLPGIGLDYYMTGLENCTDSVYDTYKAMLYNNIGVLYAESGLLGKAEQYFDKALRINLKEGKHHESFLNYANLAELYTVRGQHEKAMKASQRSLDHIDESKYPQQLAGMRLQQGIIYANKGQYDVAMTRYASALSQYKELGNIPGILKAYRQISETYLVRQMPDSALSYATEALALARREERREEEDEVLKVISEIHKTMGNYAIAMTLLHESIVLEDSLRNEESKLRLNNWETLGSEMFNIAPPEGSGPAPWSIAVMAGLSVIVILLFIYIMRRRHDHAEYRQQSREQAREYTKTIDKRNREMTTLSLEKIKTHENLTGICDDLRAVLLELNPRETAKRDRIRALLGRLETVAGGNADEEFKHFFGRVHPDLYKTLGEKHPDLTTRDQRLCAFLYLGLSTKEIAALTCREVRSVESARNRLRKKLGLELTDDLAAYLRTLAV